MSKKNKLWAKKARFLLMEKLGNRCCHCGRVDELTFDCKVPCGDAHHRGSTDQRMSFYRVQYLLDNLQVLCHSCNGKKRADGNEDALNDKFRQAEIEDLGTVNLNDPDYVPPTDPNQPF